MPARGAAPAPRGAPAEVVRNAEPDMGAVLARLTRQPVRLVSAGRPLAEVQGQLETALRRQLDEIPGARFNVGPPDTGVKM